MSRCQRPPRHLFNPSNLKAAVPATIYLRRRLVAKLSSCSRPWGAVFTVWLVRWCHYSCLWQRVRGQGVGVEPGGEGLMTMTMTNEVGWRWLLWWRPADCRSCCFLWMSLLLATTPSGWPRRCFRQVGLLEFCPRGDTFVGAIFNCVSVFKVWPLIQ